jgi:light-harvesting protein B-800-850 alpha chain
MNQGRIWCVVKPTVGLPLFLGTVLVIALLVHAAVLTHTTWYAAYWEGGSKKSASVSTVAPTVAAAPTQGTVSR